MSVLPGCVRRALRTWLRQLLFEPMPPAGQIVVYFKEIPGMANQFRASLSFPSIAPDEAGEVVSRKLVTTVNGGSPSETVIPAGQLTYDLAPLTQDDNVLVQLYNVDDAGLVSAEALSASFTVIDTIAPLAPTGEIGVALSEIPGA